MAEAIYSRNQIGDWQSELRAFAKTPRTRFTKKQAVEAMIDEIGEALENHSYQEVAEKLSKLGLDISKGLLKQYVNAYRRAHGEAKDSSYRRTSSRSKKTSKQQSKQKIESVEKPEALSNQTTNRQPAENKISRSQRNQDGFLEMPEDL